MHLDTVLGLSKVESPANFVVTKLQSHDQTGLATFDWRRFLGIFEDKLEKIHEEKTRI